MELTLATTETREKAAGMHFQLILILLVLPLFCGLRNTDTNNPTKYDSEVQPRNWTTAKFNVYKQIYGGDPWFGSFIWFAIGR